jgi:hypothetical protein
MVRVDGLPFIPKKFAVVESREMPPLPVSNIKLRVSLNVSNCPCKRITPPVSCINPNFVMNREGSINSSWAEEVFRIINNDIMEKNFFTTATAKLKKGSFN